MNRRQSYAHRSPKPTCKHEKRTPAVRMPQASSSLFQRLCRFFSGGDEENRTPVRKHCFIGFSERSLCFYLRIQTPADRLPSSDSAKISLLSLRKSTLRYPAVVLLSAQAGAKRTEAGVKPPERSLRLLLCLNKSFTLLTGW